MERTDWDRIERRKRQLVQETSDALKPEEFDILEAALRIESRYRYQARAPKRAIVSEISKFVERKIRDDSEKD